MTQTGHHSKPRPRWRILQSAIDNCPNANRIRTTTSISSFRASLKLTSSNFPQRVSNRPLRKRKKALLGNFCVHCGRIRRASTNAEASSPPRVKKVWLRNVTLSVACGCEIQAVLWRAYMRKSKIQS